MHAWMDAWDWVWMTMLMTTRVVLVAAVVYLAKLIRRLPSITASHDKPVHRLAAARVSGNDALDDARSPPRWQCRGQR